MNEKGVDGGGDLPAALQPLRDDLSVGCNCVIALQREDRSLEVVLAHKRRLKAGRNFEEGGVGDGMSARGVAGQEHVRRCDDVHKAANDMTTCGHWKRNNMEVRCAGKGCT